MHRGSSGSATPVPVKSNNLRNSSGMRSNSNILSRCDPTETQEVQPSGHRSFHLQDMLRQSAFGRESLM